MMNKILQFAKKLKVLYVEDNKEARESTLDLFSNIFKHITTAIDGKEGLEKFEGDTFDLILTDINMPKMNGLEMISLIRKQNKEIPIIVLSAYNESGYFIETIKLGVEGYLLKPINFKQFLNLIQKSVEKIQLRYELEEYQSHLELKVQEQTKDLYKQLYYDALTGLPNRNSLLKYMQEETPCCLMLMDIKNFSVINDLYGSKMGDTVLINLSELLVKISQEQYKVFRIGGDNFVLLGISSPCRFDFNESSLKKILLQIQNRSVQADNNIEINISITASVSSNTDSFNLLKNAEIALHYAKKKNRLFVEYSDELNLDNHFKKELEAVLMVKNALQEDRVLPFFQKIEKYEENPTYECLVRIKEGDKIISPYVFLDAIKKTSYYMDLTKVMIEKSFQKFEGTQINFTLNLSYEDISNHRFMEYLERKIKESSLSKQLTIEILESEHIENFELVKEFIVTMKNLGVRIAIDDFGSGYSNFSHILELNPDIIKVDGSLVRNIDTDKKSLIIVKTIIQFAQELGIETVVEFVCNKEIFDIITKLNVSGIQGYFISEPLEEIE